MKTNQSLTTITMATITPVYCDYIAHLIQPAIKYQDSLEENLISSVSGIQLELDDHGVFRGTKKTIRVEDIYGKVYQVTIEQIEG